MTADHFTLTYAEIRKADDEQLQLLFELMDQTAVEWRADPKRVAFSVPMHKLTGIGASKMREIMEAIIEYSQLEDNEGLEEDQTE